ncbi:MAG: Glu/Leu/Phe/Val dehydrogenase dimerization domain-containing protein [Haliea sp.]|uniref:Glu/Leu/Phe/Val family dehydrogenase n=1 Tax=Haliea sp. TaxID=1932666 RepID=UPI0032EB5292
MTVFSAPAWDQHELVAFGSDRASGLRAIIAVHDTTLGQGVGGCRMFPYASDEEALHDVLRLSRGMTFKSALAGLPMGGGKSVIIGDSRRDKTPALLRAMGDFVHSQGGRYVAAEDSGTGVADIRLMAERTPHVSGMNDNEFGGDPSPSTAYGVFLGIRTAVRHRLGVDSCAGLRVAVQGLGHVGYHLARHLLDDGATVYGADVNEGNLRRAVDELGVLPVAADEILALEVDILAPCAMGAVLNDRSISALRAGIVAGAANNQLATAEDCARLQDHGILYCPDFLINAGGIIDVHHQRVGSADAVKRSHIERIELTLAEVLQRADTTRQPTQEIAEDLAREYLRSAPGLKVAPLPLQAAG